MFTEFPAQNTTEWLEAIVKTLKGQSIEVLQTPLYEGFSTKPFYHQEDKIAPLLQEHDFLPFHTCLNIVPVYTTNVAEDMVIAEEYTNKGADAVCFVFQDKNPDIVPYIAQCKVPFGIQILPEAVGKLADISIESDWWLFTESTLPNTAYLQRFSKPYRKLLHTDFQPFEKEGGNAVQTIAFGFSAMVEMVGKLTEAGLSAQEVLQNMRISVSIGGNYFVEIAKLRAIRVIWRNIVQAYQASFEPLYIHASATERNKVRKDSYNNLLRNATEAMAGIVGGADSFMVLPYNTAFSFMELDQEDLIFAKRIARNTLVLLKEEAHLDKVTDIGAGSYYIEWLTKELAEKAWTLFQEVERKGGYTSAQTFIKNEIQTIAQKRQADFEAGKSILVGVNKYAVSQK
jgi:methylmalonyl-CoA mutase